MAKPALQWPARPVRMARGCTPRGACIAPLLGGVLLGTALPALGAAEGEPPLRLRLSEAIESLSRPPAPSGDPEMSIAIPVALSSPALPRLRLDLAVVAGLAVSRTGQPLNAVSLTNAASASPPEKGGSSAPRAPLLPVRPEEPISFAALEDAREVAATDAVGALAVSQSGISAVVVGDDEFLPADELDVPLPAGPRPQPGVPQPAGSGSGRGWGLAPVRWGGVLSVGLRHRKPENGTESREQLYEGRLSADSYLVQPYIALVSANVALTTVRSQSTSDGSAASSNLVGTSISGGGSLNVFPQSRFPFMAALSVSDSRSDGSLTSTNTTRQRLSLRQDYRPFSGPWSTFGTYEYSELGGTFGHDTVDVLAGGFSTVVGKHSLNANGSLSRNRSRDETTEQHVASARHSFRFDDTLAFESSASYTGQEFDNEGQGFSRSGQTRGAQLFSFASWTPYDSKWRGTANLRYFQTESSFGRSSAQSRALGGSASLSYVANNNLNLFGSLSANASTSGDRRNLASSQSVGLNYTGDSRRFGGYSYNWYSSGSFSNSTNSEGDRQHSTSASAGHSLGRNWRPSQLTTLNGNFRQAIGTSRSSGLTTTTSTNLTHSASLSLHTNPSDRISGLLGASLSDNRSVGENTSAFQLLNVQMSGSWQINSFSTFNSNLTWQLTRQESSRREDGFTLETTSQGSSLAGSLGYSHARALGVRGLRYNLDFRANTSESRIDSRRAGNPDASRERVTLDIDQRLRYRIGRLDTELQARVAEIEGRRNSLIFFRANRYFGSF